MAKQLKILIVEDQFVEANHLRLMLKKAGHSVIGMARSVPDAKYYIAEQRPELVLLDIFLSGKETGIDLAEILKNENIPFIYLSANSNEEVLSKAKLTHPQGFLVKPFREKDLLVTIEIAEYHQQYGIESSIRKELLFQKQLKTIVTKSGTWDERVLNIITALQSLISFDLVMAVFYMENKLSSRVLGYARTGLHEYQRIGIEELQNITALKESEITELRNKSKVETDATFYNGQDFIKICDKTPIKKLIATSMNMKSNLMLPVPLTLTENGGLYLSFFSRQTDNYNKNHLTLCERLQEPLIFAIENLISHDKKRDKKNTSSENIVSVNNIKDAGFESIIGKSPALLKIFDHILQVAPADTTVLITGESGTGKESIAHSIKELSNRKNQPFVKINCSALPQSLIESELFGHEKGSFTGAAERRIGKFEQADNGTLFLDEIGDMPLEMQAKLLRAIQEKEIERVGGNASIKVNVRIIAATNCNLEKEVADGRFRLDLYYRLNVFPIQLPPLRERKEDIGLLARHFIAVYSSKTGKNVTEISESALKSLLLYQWPGNIRELENLIERSILLAKTNTIEHIPLPAFDDAKINTKSNDWYFKTIQENEREHIINVLEKCNGRIRGIGGASEILGLPPTTLASRMQKLGIKRSHF
ncbi:sigma 54-interacting response regulator [Flavobacterium pectinovorum]|uniref:DNA-binding response regulator n=1 Tax=Flavobacterium pectinovorum TaxID=29533 RepID=A0AB36NZB0_9FLAO|nr:sigma 54-interacting response regulator [Flavobacterium pectinovorum]OXB03740.1 DNA-binding response regulator [Flavobacterium pectinovorum]SHL65574.1 Transcriptional regulator containing GAF, AAA-type ATPase, and DNA-binding Fis domains [Flavobacterium pectinovorum]